VFIVNDSEVRACGGSGLTVGGDWTSRSPATFLPGLPHRNPRPANRVANTSATSYVDPVSSGTTSTAPHFLVRVDPGLACTKVLEFQIRLTSAGGRVLDDAFTLSLGAGQSATLLQDTFETAPRPGARAAGSWRTAVRGKGALR